MTMEKRGSGDGSPPGSPPAGSRGRAPVRVWGRRPGGRSLAEAETLLLNEHAIFNAHLMKTLWNLYMQYCIAWKWMSLWNFIFIQHILCSKTRYCRHWVEVTSANRKLTGSVILENDRWRYHRAFVKTVSCDTNTAPSVRDSASSVNRGYFAPLSFVRLPVPRTLNDLKYTSCAVCI